jgi:SSS family solute:Na+ symporter
MVHKFYTIKDERSIKAGSVVSTAFAIIIAGGCYFLGGFGKLFVNPADGGLPDGGYDNIIPTMMENLPDILLGITVIMVLSASMSTLSSLVLTSSSSITLDLIKPKKDKDSILIMRFLIVAFLIISVVVALFKNQLIADMMGYSWGALAGAFLAPMMYGLFWKKVTRMSVYINFIFAIGLTLAHFIVKPSFVIAGFDAASPVNLGAFIMVVSLILVPLFSLATKKDDEKYIESVFSCYTEQVTVQHAAALTGNEDS